MFTEEEQQQLKSILTKLTPDEFQILKIHFTTKSNSAQTLNRSSFSQEEDNQLKALVEEFGDKNWPEIASHMKNRTTRQCRERYRHYLSPNIVNGEWTPQEDEILLQKYNEFGPRWVTIAKFFKTRTDINVKNRWIVLMRRSVTKQSVNSPRPEPKRKGKRQAHLVNDFKRALLVPQITPLNMPEQVEEVGNFIEEFDTFTEWNVDNPIELM